MGATDSIGLSIQQLEIQIHDLKSNQNYKGAYETLEKLRKAELTALENRIQSDIEQKGIKERFSTAQLKDSLKYHLREDLNAYYLQEANLKNEQSKDFLIILGTLLGIASIGAIGLWYLRGKLQGLTLKMIHEKREVERQFQTSQQQKGMLVHQKKMIDESLAYAKKIQKEILPDTNKLRELLGDYFVFFKPKYDVSGDFYWMRNEGDVVYFAVGDSTGHGVPGAMVSFINFNKLDEAFVKDGIRSPELLLEKTKEKITLAFKNDKDQLKDGMDCVLIKLDALQKKLEFSGANNPLFIVRNDDVVILKGDRQPVGYTDYSSPFTVQKIDLQTGDKIYLFSDGFQDQFGGGNDKKYKVRRFRDFLLQIHQKPMEEQKILVQTEFEAWKGDEEQTDDVIIFGIEIK